MSTELQIAVKEHSRLPVIVVRPSTPSSCETHVLVWTSFVLRAVCTRVLCLKALYSRVIA